MTDASDRIPWDVEARLSEPLDDLARSLEVWQGRDEAGPPQAHVRRAASTGMGKIDEMLRELHLMRARLVSEIRESDDLAMARSAALLERLRGEREATPVLGLCVGCREATLSVPCPRCGGPACAGCGRCPECHGPLPEDPEEEDGGEEM